MKKKNYQTIYIHGIDKEGFSHPQYKCCIVPINFENMIQLETLKG